MSKPPTMTPPRFVLLISDPGIGQVWGVATDREHFEFRVTPTGLIRLGETHREVPAWDKDKP